MHYAGCFAKSFYSRLSGLLKKQLALAHYFPQFSDKPTKGFSFLPPYLLPSFLPSFLSFFLAVLGRRLFIKIMYLNKIPRIPSTWPVDLAILLVLAKSVTVNSEKIIPPL
jgi:hypothetical protein